MGKRVYVSVTYLWSFSPAELGLPDDATDAEIYAAAEVDMEKITNQIADVIDIIPNDVEIEVC